MSLENFFATSGSTKRKDGRKKGVKINANAVLASQDNEHVDFDNTM